MSCCCGKCEGSEVDRELHEANEAAHKVARIALEIVSIRKWWNTSNVLVRGKNLREKTQELMDAAVDYQRICEGEAGGGE